MNYRTLFRHVKESFKNLGRNGWMTFASVSAVTVTLSLVGVFVVLMMNLNNFATNVESDVEVRVHIDRTATEEQSAELGTSIEKLSQVEKVTLSPKEDELNNIIASMGDDGKAFELFEQDNPLNDVYVVKTKTPQDVVIVAQEAEKMDYVDTVEYGQNYVEKLFNIVSVSRNVGFVLIIALLLTAMFLISNTIKVTIFARRREIEIMRLVGATNGFIRWPFFLEGLWLGVLGSIIPITLIAVGYKYMYDHLSPSMTIDYMQMLAYNPFILQVSGLLILFGALIGIWGSLMSIRKFLKA
ncbi:permease-like cell division protein FtsX [Pradoshia sp.]